MQNQLFPDEILLKIFSYLNYPDLGRCAQVSKKMQSVCFDESLKYHLMIDAYQNYSPFIKVLLQSKEFILVLKLMRTEPQFWSKAYDPVECTVEPLEQSQDWHKSMKLDDRHQMVAIYIQAEEAEKINLAKLIEKRAYETAISRHQYFRLIIKSIRIKLRKQRFYANHSLPHQRNLGHPNENVSTEQDEGEFKCIVCGANFASVQELGHHGFSHFKPK